MDQLVGDRLSSDASRKRECHAGRCCLRLHKRSNATPVAYLCPRQYSHLLLCRSRRRILAKQIYDFF